MRRRSDRLLIDLLRQGVGAFLALENIGADREVVRRRLALLRRSCHFRLKIQHKALARPV
jgi:hypothetical protein